MAKAQKVVVNRSDELESWYRQNKPDLDLALKSAKIPQWSLLNFGDKVQIYNFLYKQGEYQLETTKSIDPKKVTLH